MKTVSFKTDKSGITIRIPRTLINHVAKHHPEGIVVTDAYRLHESVAEQLENNLGQEGTGLTGFQELLDAAISECAIDGDAADFKQLDD